MAAHLCNNVKSIGDLPLICAQDATDKADSDTGNLQQVINGENEVVFIWGNLNKNPRFKTFEFKFEFMQFEIPKILAISDIAGTLSL